MGDRSLSAWFRRWMSPSAVVSGVLVVGADVLTLSLLNRLPRELAVHWNARGTADEWGPASNVFALPAVVTGVVLICYVLRMLPLADYTHTLVADVVDAFAPPFAAVLGFLGVFMADDAIPVYPGMRHTSIFLVFSACGLISGGVAGFLSRRIMMADGGNGSCLMDLSIPSSRYWWSSILVLGGCAGLACALTMGTATTHPVPGGMSALIQVITFIGAWAVAFAVSNRTHHREARLAPGR